MSQELVSLASYLFFLFQQGLIKLALAWLRIAPVMFFLPFFSNKLINGGIIKNCVVVYIALGLWPFLSAADIQWEQVGLTEIFLYEIVIGLVLAFIVLEETGHGSLMQMLANEISSAVTKMLIEFGVPEEKAKQIGSIVGMIVAAIAFLAISLLSMSSMVKNAVSAVKNVVKLLLKNIGTLLKTTIKTLPKSLMTALGNIATKAGKASDLAADTTSNMAKLTKFTKLADKFDDVKDASKAVKQLSSKADDVTDVSSNIDKVKKGKEQSVAMEKLEVAARGMNAGVTVLSTATTGGLNLHAASMGEKMKEMLAGMMLNNSAIEAITELLNQLIKSMSKNYEQFDEMFTSMLNGLLQSGQNKANMMKTARYA